MEQNRFLGAEVENDGSNIATIVYLPEVFLLLYDFTSKSDSFHSLYKI